MLVTEKQFQRHCDNYKGYCKNCKKFTRRQTESDARGYDCPKCKKNTVYGAEEALFMGYIGIK